MRYEYIALQADHYTATRQYVAEVYGESIAQQFPNVADTVWQSVLMGMPEELCWMTVLGDHRLSPLKHD